MNNKTPSENAVRQKATRLGYRLSKIRENSRDFNECGPFMITDANKLNIRHGMTLQEANELLANLKRARITPPAVGSASGAFIRHRK